MSQEIKQNIGISQSGQPLDQTSEDEKAAVVKRTPEQGGPAEGTLGGDDDAATAEEMAEFIRNRRARKEQKKASSDDDERDVFGEYVAPENSIDPYIEPDPTLPWPTHQASQFLSRGCHRCPKSYVPVSESEISSCSKLTACDWLRGIRQPSENPFDVVEVRFKNNRKAYFRLPEGLSVGVGDVVAVEGTPGHDVGIVSLTGEVCLLQMKKHKVDPADPGIKKLFRRAKVSDIERWEQAVTEEEGALFRTRQIASDLGLEMKVNDVEFQGDHSKAIFYYTADDRVDFRDLIKLLADAFKVRVEMKQIGVRQEAGKVGGLGTCGRELCCSTWLSNFKSVTTAAAKAQQILPNPQKLAGQCGKLKCCLNFEYEVYADALKAFPPAGTAIRFKKGLALYKKTDVLRGIMWYAYENENELYALPAESVKRIIEMNERQEYPETLEEFQVQLMSTDALVQEEGGADAERELSRMADIGGNESMEEHNMHGHDNRGGRRGDRRDQSGNGHRHQEQRGGQGESASNGGERKIGENRRQKERNRNTQNGDGRRHQHTKPHQQHRQPDNNRD